MDRGQALKITPCHDFNDCEIGLRHNLDFISVVNKDGKLEGGLVPKILIGKKF